MAAYVTLSQAAEAAGVSVQRVKALIRGGKLKAERFSPRAVLIPEEEFEAWMQRRKTTGKN